MFTGLCAFPLTPLHQQHLDEKAFIRILSRLTDTGVDSLGILGSTGSYAYLSREQRKRVVQVAKAHVGSIPMMVGVGAIATSEVLRLVEDAQQAGADALLLPMMSYQRFLRRRSLPSTKRSVGTSRFRFACMTIPAPLTSRWRMSCRGASLPCRPSPRLKFPACLSRRRVSGWQRYAVIFLPALRLAPAAMPWRRRDCRPVAKSGTRFAAGSFPSFQGRW